MAIAGNLTNLTEWQVAYKAETASQTANVATMQLINLMGQPTFSDNVYRAFDVKHGVGRTLKAVDMRAQTKGQIKTMSGTSRFNASQFSDFLSNAVGLAPEVTGELDIPFNYTPPTVLPGDVDDDNTGTFTFAVIPPEATNAQIWAGCAVTSLRVYSDATADGAYFMIDWEVSTQNEISTDQATPGSMVAYTISELGFYDLCTTKTYNAIDIALLAFELTINPNTVFNGMSADGTPASIGRGHPIMEVTGSITVDYDTNTQDFYKYARAKTGYALVLSDGDNVNITVALALATADAPASDKDGVSAIVIPFTALASTSGNVAEIEIGENA